MRLSHASRRPSPAFTLIETSQCHWRNVGAGKHLVCKGTYVMIRIGIAGIGFMGMIPI
jgi:hypothetical protein